MQPVRSQNEFRPLDIGIVYISSIGIVLSLALLYYGIRTLKLFKGNAAARAWIYISLSAMFFSIGVVTFLVNAMADFGLIPAGGVLMTLGGFFLFLGLRKNYLFWASKDHFS